MSPGRCKIGRRYRRATRPPVGMRDAPNLSGAAAPGPVDDGLLRTPFISAGLDHCAATVDGTGLRDALPAPRAVPEGKFLPSRRSRLPLPRLRRKVTFQRDWEVHEAMFKRCIKVLEGFETGTQRCQRPWHGVAPQLGLNVYSVDRIAAGEYAYWARPMRNIIRACWLETGVLGRDDAHGMELRRPCGDQSLVSMSVTTTWVPSKARRTWASFRSLAHGAADGLRLRTNRHRSGERPHIKLSVGLAL